MYVSERDVKFKAVRASGPGGQRANRRSTKVQLWVKIGDLPLTEQQKKRLRQRLTHHLNHRDELWVYDQEERSQEMNKDKALARLNSIIVGALQEPPPRIPTERPRRAEERRIIAKKIKSEKKKSRRIVH